MAYINFLNYIFAPLLNLPPVWALIILSFLISLIMILLTKYTTNQKLMKSLKDEIKSIQGRMKESKKDPSKVMDLNKKAMELNMKYMMQSFKPTLIMLVPTFLILGWMSFAFGYDSIKPGQSFNVTVFLESNSAGNVTIIAPDGIEVLAPKTGKIGDARADWTLKGNEGEYALEFDHGGSKAQHSVLITSGNRHLEPVRKIKESQIKSIQVDYKPKKVLNLFGWKVGWLLTYILFSLIFTLALRKFMYVY